MELWELVARESARDLVHRYAANVDSGRFDQVVELFAPDAVMDIEGRLYEGQDEIRTIFQGAYDGLQAAEPRWLRHCISTHQIDVVSPTQAKGRVYYHVLMAHGLDHWGRYVDDYGLVDGRWVFTRRREIMDGTVEGGWGASNSAG